jgi:CMP-N,N'-diacetyllegionaminic acid synthase
MKLDLKIIALIPARSGSKTLPNKNIKLYKGIPLLAHSIKIALDSKYINDVYVSSDSDEYNKIALEYGAKIILRPKDISNDLSPDIDTFIHFLKESKINPDIIIHLRPTYPNRNINLLNDCIEQFLNYYNNYDSLRTVQKIDKTPYKMYYIENNNLIPFIKSYKNYIEPYNQARQIFPDSYIHNGCIDIIKTDIIKNNILSGERILPYIMKDNDDIDDLDDFIKSENNLIS